MKRAATVMTVLTVALWLALAGSAAKAVVAPQTAHAFGGCGAMHIIDPYVSTSKGPYWSYTTNQYIYIYFDLWREYDNGICYNYHVSAWSGDSATPIYQPQAALRVWNNGNPVPGSPLGGCNNGYFTWVCYSTLGVIDDQGGWLSSDNWHSQLYISGPYGQTYVSCNPSLRIG
jgi:hypothetical protein